MEGSSRSDLRDHDAESGELEGPSGYKIEEVAFELLLAGIPESIIFGWHDGWDWDRLLRLYLFLREKKLEEQELATTSTSLAVASVLSKKPILKEVRQKTQRIINDLRRRRTSCGPETEDERAARKVAEGEKFFAMLGGVPRMDAKKHKGTADEWLTRQDPSKPS